MRAGVLDFRGRAFMRRLDKGQEPKDVGDGLQALDSKLISIVIPCYNERERIQSSLTEIRNFLAAHALPVEVLVVVEKSADGTLEAAQAAAENVDQIRVIDNKVHRGKGYAVRSGMAMVQGDPVFFMDADLATPLEEIHHFLDWFDRHPNCDVLIGNRVDVRSNILIAQSPWRRLLGRGFNKLVMLFGIRGIADTQCGFKAFRRQASKEIFSRQKLDRYAFDVEGLMLADRLGLQIVSLPISWRNRPDSKISMLRDATRMLWDLLWVRRLVGRTMRQQPKL